LFGAVASKLDVWGSSPSSNLEIVLIHVHLGHAHLPQPQLEADNPFRISPRYT